MKIFPPSLYSPVTSDIYLAVDNVDEEYERLKAKGVDFVEPPKKQYGGGCAASFADQDENLVLMTETKD